MIARPVSSWLCDMPGIPEECHGSDWPFISWLVKGKPAEAPTASIKSI